jgi:hypothetical protein
VTPYIVTHSRTLPHDGHTDHYVYVYDQDRPRQPQSDNPCARYAIVESFGPFPTENAARQVANRRRIGVGW